jgi:hypothetical protein
MIRYTTSFSPYFSNGFKGVLVAYPHICIISCFPIRVFLEINQGIDYSLNLAGYDRVTTRQSIPIFSPRGFSKGIREHINLKIDAVKGGVLQKVLLTSSMEHTKGQHTMDLRP